MGFSFLRALFACVCMIVGYQIGMAYQHYGADWGLRGMGVGAAIALAVIIIEKGLGKISMRGLSAAVFGLILSLIISKFLNTAIDLIPLSLQISSVLKLSLTLVLVYLGVVFSMRGRDEFNIVIPYIKFDRQDQKDALIILDTSAIIDGRILDILETKFIEGHFVIPKFVLKELHQLSDSNDAVKRSKGKRGLEIINKIRKNDKVRHKIHDDDFPEIPTVDEKLIQLGRVLRAKILTTDYNLNKIAEFQGVSILNINELAIALKPVVLPGEALEIKLVREGKESNQAVGHLEDGTMVVVDNAKRLLGQSVKVSVASVLQTQGGRIIFARLDSDH